MFKNYQPNVSFYNEIYQINLLVNQKNKDFLP